MKRRRRLGLYATVTLTSILLVALVATFLILPSDWFEQKVRERIIAEVERITGGRAEIGTFRFEWTRMTAHVAPFVLHGTEPPNAAPLFAADSIDVGLKIVSLIKRDIDVASLRIDRPQVNIIVDKDGITNFPSPRIPHKGKNPVEELISLAIRNVNVSRGTLQIAEQRLPLELEGQNLEARLAYHFRGPRYTGSIRFERLRFGAGKMQPMTVELDSRIALERNRLRIEAARIAMPRSTVEASGEVTDFTSPHASLNVNARGDLAELGGPLKLPEPHTGTVMFTGVATYAAGKSYEIAGQVSGRGLGLDQGSIRVRNISVDAGLQIDPRQATLRGLVVKALDGSFTGSAAINNGFHTLKVNGELNGVSVAELARAAGVSNVPWNGKASGPIDIAAGLRASSEMKAAGTIHVAPIAGSPPVEGTVEFAYDRTTGALELGDSYLNTTASRLRFHGGFGRQLQVRVETHNLNELIPLLAMAGKSAQREVPVQINPGGMATFEGTVTGPAKSAHVSGALHATNVTVQGETLDSIAAEIQANASSAHLGNVVVIQGGAKLQGAADVPLHDWQPVNTVPLAANLRVQNASVKSLMARAGVTLPIEGTVDATLNVNGTIRDPTASMHLAVANPVIYGERLDRFTADVRYAGTAIEVIDGVGQLGPARVVMNGTYTHAPEDWKDGHVRFNVSTSNLTLSRIQRVQNLHPDARGAVDFKAEGEAAVRNGEVLVQTLTGRAGVRQLVIAGEPVGNVAIDAKTAGRELTLGVAGDVRGSNVRGNALVQLTGDYPAKGELTFGSIDLRTVLDLARTGGAAPVQPPPVEATTQGRITFTGPARKLDMMTARLELPELKIVPRARSQNRAQARDLTLRSEGPVVVELDPMGVHVRSARFVGPDTNLAVAGTLNYKTKTPWDLKVNGEVNLAVLSDINSDVISSGGATVAASVHGTLQNPELEGSLELKNASFYVTDFPNGLDQLNGTIIFDRKRATIRRLTGLTGGGQVTLGGFVGYGTGEWIYRMNARAEGVRIRYPEGASLTANGVLSLNGTSSRSLASGTITVLRAGFNPRTDIGGLLVASAKPIQPPTTPNETLRNLQLDVRVETIPNLMFQTTLTQGLQAEADLRIRGTAAKPSVLGHIAINQGEIQFFGNTYTITRGDIGFYNPVRIEPVVDLDLETRVRGIVVDINFSGSISKLTVAYRSDPPLQSSEIIALLAVGRVPGETTGIAASQATQSQNSLATSTNSLVGQAVSAPMSNRLQRFFGVSRLKIDPTLQNLDAVPQARLTMEQQISKDVTLTFITNLSNTNQQIVRLQWDLNKNWSVLAVRDENGLFGIDFLYKRRFR